LILSPIVLPPLIFQSDPKIWGVWRRGENLKNKNKNKKSKWKRYRGV